MNQINDPSLDRKLHEDYDGVLLTDMFPIPRPTPSTEQAVVE